MSGSSGRTVISSFISSLAEKEKQRNKKIKNLASIQFWKWRLKLNLRSFTWQNREVLHVLTHAGLFLLFAREKKNVRC